MLIKTNISKKLRKEKNAVGHGHWVHPSEQRKEDQENRTTSLSVVHFSVGDHFPISNVTFLIKLLEEKTRKSECNDNVVQHFQHSRQLRQYSSNKTKRHRKKTYVCVWYNRPNKVVVSQLSSPDTMNSSYEGGKFHLFPGLEEFIGTPETGL